MKYFVPELALGALLPLQTQLAEKFGGQPWGLPIDRWPLCRECGNPQTHLATLVHHTGRLDLGKEGRAVLVFQCGHTPNETECETSEDSSGANAVVLLNADEIGCELTLPPVPGAVREIEMRIVSWEERHDLVTPELEASFYNADGFWDQPDEARQAIEDSIEYGAKLGSVPCFVQGPEEVSPPFHFAAQFAMYYHFPDPIPTADEAGVKISRWDKTAGELGDYLVSEPKTLNLDIRGEIYVSDLTIEQYGSGFDVEAADFGDGGIAYLFVNPNPVAPKGRFSWQCG